jgi:hypothetical protein
MQQDGILVQAADALLDARSNYREAEQMLRTLLFRRALERCGGNICHAAAMVGVHRNHFTRDLEQMQIRDLPKQIREARRKEAEQLDLWSRPAKRSRAERRRAAAAA